MGKRYKLPFTLSLKRKYNEINIEEFVEDWEVYSKDRETRNISIDNAIHVEIGKFQTWDLSIEEVVDLAIRYALGKQEFRKLSARLIEIKKEQII